MNIAGLGIDGIEQMQLTSTLVSKPVSAASD
jgi:hypothetical protein